MEHLEGTYEFQYIHNNQDLTSNLRKFRNNIAMSQKQVASILDIERSTYTYYEHGKTLPNIFTLLKISKIFKVHIFYLLAKDGYNLYIKNSNSDNAQEAT